MSDAKRELERLIAEYGHEAAGFSGMDAPSGTPKGGYFEDGYVYGVAETVAHFKEKLREAGYEV